MLGIFCQRIHARPSERRCLFFKNGNANANGVMFGVSKLGPPRLEFIGRFYIPGHAQSITLELYTINSRFHSAGGKSGCATSGALFQPAAEDCGGVFADGAVVGGEGGEEMAVNIQLADDFLFDEDGDDDFGFGFEGTGEVTRIGADVVNDDGLAGGGSGTADALIQRDARVRGHGAAKGAEDEHVLLALFFEHVKADPVVT
jgi:hypothetical protein